MGMEGTEVTTGSRIEGSEGTTGVKGAEVTTGSRIGGSKGTTGSVMGMEGTEVERGSRMEGKVVERSAILFVPGLSLRLTCPSSSG